MGNISSRSNSSEGSKLSLFQRIIKFLEEIFTTKSYREKKELTKYALIEIKKGDSQFTKGEMQEVKEVINDMEDNIDNIADNSNSIDECEKNWMNL
jgi:hypothetical protein